MIWVAPLRSHCTPMTISPLDWALEVAGASRLSPASASAITMARNSRMDVLLSSRTSVREWLSDADTERATSPRRLSARRHHPTSETRVAAVAPGLEQVPSSESGIPHRDPPSGPFGAGFEQCSAYPGTVTGPSPFAVRTGEAA